MQSIRRIGRKAMMETNITPPLLDAKEVKTILRCSLPLIYKMADRGQIPCVRIPCSGKGKPKSLLRFKKIDVINFIENNYQGRVNN
jgi:predicted DNA-binding transcriptional regulator AlpA